jgi:hypothetical protein
LAIPVQLKGVVVVVTVVVVVEDVVVGVVLFVWATQLVPFQEKPLRHMQALGPLLTPTLLTIAVQFTEVWLNTRVVERHHTIKIQRIFIVSLFIQKAKKF